MDGGGPELVDAGDGPSLRYGGRWLYSRFSPRGAARKAAEAVEVQGSTLYLVPSPCLGHGLSELARKIPPDSALVCLEADPALFDLASLVIRSSWPPGLRRPVLARASDALSAYREAESGAAPARLRRVVEARLSGGRSLDDAAYDRAVASIRADMSIRFRNRLAMARMGRLWLRNTITNLSAIGWERCAPLEPGDKLVVACGAGPSLDRAIPALSRRRDEVFLLACDTAAGAMAQAGLAPDAVVCLEAQVYNVADYLPLGRTGIAHAIDISAHPSTFRAAEGAFTLMASEWMDGPFMSRLASAGLPIAPVPPLGSVGVLALRLARSFGKPFALTGLDFSFPAGRTHCVGSPSDLAERRSETRLSKRAGSYRASFREGAEAIPSGWRSDPALSMYAALAASELEGADAYDLRPSLAAPLPAFGGSPGASPGLSWADGSVEERRIEALLDEAIGRRGSALNRAASAASASGADTVGDGERPCAYGPCRPFGSRGDGSDAARARAFLEGEAARVRTLAAMLRSGAAKEELGDALAESDFLYAHFPDPERVSSLEPDALKRVAAEAAYWSGRLDEALRA